MDMNNWRKASYSNGQGSCVEAGNVAGNIGVRDTKQDERGPVLRFTLSAWRTFITTQKNLPATHNSHGSGLSFPDRGCCHAHIECIQGTGG